MRFALLVQAAPDHSAASTALSLAKALHHHPEHQLYRLFLYRDAVALANRVTWQGAPQAPSPAHQWQAFLQQEALEAMVCVGAAQRRGVRDDELASNLAPGFTLAGLGEWADAQLNSDRVIQFG